MPSKKNTRALLTRMRPGFSYCLRPRNDRSRVIGRAQYVTSLDAQKKSPKGVDRRVMGKKIIEFLQSSNSVVVRALSDDDVEVTIDPAFLKSLDGNPIPPTTKNLGGYSGSPLLVVSAEPLRSQSGAP